MSKFSHLNPLSWLAVLAATLFLSACAATAPAEQPPEDAAEKAYEIEPWDGEGLDIPLDGSSMEAWNRSMARVKAHVTENEYLTLKRSVDFLLLYDLPSEGDKNKLIKRLDGQTGNEIIERVRWRLDPRGESKDKPASSGPQTIES